MSGSARTAHTILAFGDSLTWGRAPESRERHAPADRWPSVVEAELGATVIAEGLPGRTTVFDDFSGATDRNGARCLPVLLGSHQPLDLVVIMLGSNDLKPSICGSVGGVVAGLERLVGIVRGFAYETAGPTPGILLVSPPAFRDTTSGEGPRAGRSVTESLGLAAAVEALCARLDCLFLDAGAVAETSSVDGVHLDAENTRAVGRAVAGLLERHMKSARRSA